jgi:hypothetical protein
MEETSRSDSFRRGGLFLCDRSPHDALSGLESLLLVLPSLLPSRRVRK